MKIPYRQTYRRALLTALCLTLVATMAQALQTLSSTPPFLQSGVQPNIMFGVDDSGSMDWETVIPSKVKETYTDLKDDIEIVNPRDAFYKDWFNNVFINRDEILYACSGINRMFYDPTKTYTPWYGLDDAGKEFSNQSISSARDNPYHATGSTKDLSATSADGDFYKKKSYGYFKWRDLNNNGEWDPWNDSNDDGVVDVDELECPTEDLTYDQLDEWYTDASEMSTAAEKTNYANWYSYYRKRDYVAKRALTQIVNESVARMGLTTLHNRNSVYTEVKDVDDITLPQDETAKTNKAALLKNIARISPKDNTPLRVMLMDIGNYFAGFTARSDSPMKNDASPILAADDGGKCQQNFAILMSDGAWNSSLSPNVGNEDGNNDSKWDDGIYKDDYSETLADVAMHFYETDLKNSYADEVPILSNVDENPAQHLVTYTVAFGLTGTLDKELAGGKDPADVSGFKWPKAESGKETTIDDMRHAAYNARGLYLSADDPQELIDSLNESIQNVQDRTSTASTVAVTSGAFNGLSMAFRTEFDSTDWQGRIEGVPLKWNTNTQQFEYDDSPASIIKASIVPNYNDRNIVTHNGTTGVPFRYDSLSEAQKNVLKSKDLVNFIRGDDSQESDLGGSYRERNVDTGSKSYLGDFVNSSPLYIADPQFRYPDSLETKLYSDYRKDPDGDGKKTTLAIAGESYTLRRTPMIYVGGNDGMLHGFKVDPDPDATDFGQETFAYVPSMVMSRFEKLAAKKYYHTYTVDGTPVSGDAYIKDEWRTVLVGGLNAGGQGIYALDVSKPQKFTSETEAAKYVLWEFDDGDDKDLGFTFSKPIIARANNTNDKKRWVAIFGNGYNNTENDTAVGSGTAVLYVVNLADGTLIRKIDTEVNKLSGANGLSSPTAVDIDGDYDVDYVYAGDLEGNLWKFDLSNSDPKEWKVAYQETSSENKTVNVPLFTACSVNNCNNDEPDKYRQSITAKPIVRFNTEAGNGYLIYFGTGKYIFDEDTTDTSLQTFYAVWDRKQSTFKSFKREHLLRQEILAEQNLAYTDTDGTVYSEGNWQRVTSRHTMKWFAAAGLPASDSGYYLGWYMDLTIDGKEDKTAENSYDLTGERVVLDAQYVSGENNYLEFYTLIPDTDPCSAGSDGWIMRLDPNSGGHMKLGEEVVDANRDGKLDAKDRLEYSDAKRPSSGFKAGAGQGISGLGSCVYIVLPDGSQRCLTADGDELSSANANLGRWNWKELR